MAQVKGTKGNKVSVEIFGISEVLRQLQATEQQVFKGADLGVVRAGTFIQEEVKESIIGNRAEPRSVDTGNFANSVQFEKLGEAQGKVLSDVSYAQFLEYGTSRMKARNHFRNTKVRNEKNIKEIINKEVKKII